MTQQDHASDDEDDKKVKQPKPRQHDAGASDLEVIKDFRSEEVDIGFIDTSALAVSKAKEEPSVKVKLNKDDIDLIATQMLITPAMAERCLRDHRGDVKAALTFLVNN